MNSFLGNLINRHHHPSTRVETSVVEPRPKSRFESDAVSTVEPNGIEGDSFSSTTASKELSETVKNVQQENREYEPIQAEAKQPIPVPESLERGPADKQENQLSLNRVDDLNARIEEFSLQLGNKLSVAEPEVDGQLNRRPYESESPQGLTNNKTQVDSHSLSMANALNQQVDSVIRRLANQKTEHKNEQGRNVKQTSSFVGELTPDFKQQGRTTQIAPDVAEPASKSGILNNESQPEQHTVPQPGLLQQPGWLTEMQSDLNKRWQDINTRLKPSDPVVNVTIGRVEVRAVKAQAPQQLNKKKKPNGVMSLDDYLKERA